MGIALLFEDWAVIVPPVAVAVLSLLGTIWLRRWGGRRVQKWLVRVWPEGGAIAVRAFRVPTLLWCIFISASMGVAVSPLTEAWRMPVARGLWTLLAISAVVAVLNLATGLMLHYGLKLELRREDLNVIKNAVRGIILVVGVLMVLEIWSVPTTPILVLILLLGLVGVVALRNAVPNLFAGLQLAYTEQIRVGDYIRLDTGEEGYVVDLGWNSTRIQTLAETTVIIPNTLLTQRKVVNYGRPLKKASEPFHFNSRTHLKELTGLKARNLPEMVGILRQAPDGAVYYHTHHFLEEHHYLIPMPANDFAIWVSDALGDEVLGEKLASLDVFGFPKLGELRDRLCSIIEESMAAHPLSREAMPGREFHFMKSVSVVFSTPYVASDLRELVQALRQISLGSLYYHIFESRVRLGRGLNDFSTWLQDSLGEPELAEEIARLDPYTYTLEGLRSALIRIIEKRVK